jgi:hypothetical protein
MITVPTWMRAENNGFRVRVFCYRMDCWVRCQVFDHILSRSRMIIAVEDTKTAPRPFNTLHRSTLNLKLKETKPMKNLRARLNRWLELKPD